MERNALKANAKSEQKIYEASISRIYQLRPIRQNSLNIYLGTESEGLLRSDYDARSDEEDVFLRRRDLLLQCVGDIPVNRSQLLGKLKNYNKKSKNEE